MLLLDTDLQIGETVYFYGVFYEGFPAKRYNKIVSGKVYNIMLTHKSEIVYTLAYNNGMDDSYASYVTRDKLFTLREDAEKYLNKN